MGRRAADVDGGTRGTGPEQEGLAVRADLVAIETVADEGQRRIGYPAPAPALDPEGAELGVHPADADAEHQPLAGQLLDARDLLRDRQGRAVGKDQGANAEPDGLGSAGQPGERDEGVHVAPVRALRIFRRNGNVIHHPRGLQTGGLGRGGTGRHGNRSGLVTHVAGRRRQYACVDSP